MSLLFLTFGPTHSGKTTFGARLRVTLGESAKFIHVDNDAVDEFIKANYNNLRTDPDVLARRSPSDPDLRLRIPQLIADYALGEQYSVIATAAHPKRVIRQSYYDIARKNGAQVVLLIFRIDEEKVLQRIEKNNRSTDILDKTAQHGMNFHDLFARQKRGLEDPIEEEKRACFKAFEVTEANFDEVLRAAAELVSQ